MKISDYIAQEIAKEVDIVFCGNGGVVIHLLDSLNKTVKLVPTQTEQGAAIAAEGYARIHGFGVAVATSGPGFVNLIQGIACAYYDSTPVLYIVGAPPTKHLKQWNDQRQNGFQEMEVCDIVKSFTKYAVRADVHNIDEVLYKAIEITKEGRKGPVLIEIPDDVQYSDRTTFVSYHLTSKSKLFYPRFVNVYLEKLAKAERPLIIIGGGARGCSNLPIYWGVPFVSTWASQDMFVGNEDWVGSFGITGSLAANLAVQQADLILVLGCKLDTHNIGANRNKFVPKADIFIIDIDEMEHKDALDCRVWRSTSSIEDVMKYVIGSSLRFGPIQNWCRTIHQYKDEFSFVKEEYYKEKDYVNPYVFMKQLASCIDDDAIVITDAGATLTWTMQAFLPRVKHRLFSAFNHSPMGYALPAAIGAYYANPDKQIICIIGDGGLAMCSQELETIVFNKLPIKIFVMNNNGYGIMRQTQDMWLEGRRTCVDETSGLGMPDIRNIATAYDLDWSYLHDHDDFKSLYIILNCKEAQVVEVKINPEAKIVPKLKFGKSLEDME